MIIFVHWLSSKPNINMLLRETGVVTLRQVRAVVARVSMDPSLQMSGMENM